MTSPPPALRTLAGLPSSGMTAAQYRAQLASSMTEAQLQANVRKLSDAYGWRSYHTHRSDRSDPGFPDLVLVRGPVVLWRELKTQRGRVRPEQQQWLEALVGAGQDAAIWRPEDLLEQRIDRTLRSTR